MVIDLPKEICKQVPIFEKPLYEGELDDDLNLYVEPITLMPDTNRNELVFALRNGKYITKSSDKENYL